MEIEKKKERKKEYKFPLSFLFTKIFADEDGFCGWVNCFKLIASKQSFATETFLMSVCDCVLGCVWCVWVPGSF